MINILKFNDEQKLFFSADYHYNHKKNFVWEARGFKNPQEHCDFLIETTNAIIGENDIFFHLGDLTLETKPDEFYEFIQKIKCKNICLIWGNHPNPIRPIFLRKMMEFWNSIGCPYEMHEVPEIYPYPVANNAKIFGHYLELKHKGEFITLGHYPILVFNKMHRHSWNLCGHSHGSLKESLPDYKDAKRLDVGIDVHKKPLSFDEIKTIMYAKRSMVLDHHDKSVN